MPIRQRIEGQVTRNFALQLVKRTAAAAPVDGDGSAEQALLADNLILEFSFASEFPYLRADSFWDEPWMETPGLAEGECDLSTLNSGAPVFLNHGRDKTEKAALRTIGRSQRAWIENGKAYVEVKLSRRDDMEGLVRDIQDEIVADVSVGYEILERTLTKQAEGKPDEYRLTKWRPREITICDMPVDTTVGLGRTADLFSAGQPVPAHRYTVVDLPDEGLTLRGSDMPGNQNAASGGAQQPDIAAITAAATTAERTRSADIRLAVRSANLDANYADELIAADVTVDAARAAVLTKLAERTAAAAVTSRADIQLIGDETETRRELMAESLLHRANPSHKLNDGARQYAGLSLIELARDCLEIRGIKTRGMDKLQLVGRAFEGTSDLPSVLANVANKSLRAAYLSAPRTFTPWARQASAADFKTISRANLSDAPALEKVNENGEFKRGKVTDGKETYQLATVGKVIGLTRQSIINDDLGAFTRLPALFANAAANYESDTVYGIITANAALSDTVALFHATHANLTASGTALSVTSLGVGRTLMRKQTTPNAAAVMNLQPKFLIVPAALETIAAQYVSQAYIAAQSSNINPFAGALQVVSEGRLDANSATAWYLAASTDQVDTVEYCYLEGQDGVYIETRQGFDVDGMEIKARLDFAAKAIDHRGLYKNPGA